MYALLEKQNLQDVAFHLQADQCVFQSMWTDTLGARACAPPRAQFTYVDLTSKELLPLWLTAESIGGKSTMQDADLLDPSATTGSLSQLATALRAATTNPR